MFRLYGRIAGIALTNMIPLDNPGNNITKRNEFLADISTKSDGASSQCYWDGQMLLKFELVVKWLASKMVGLTQNGCKTEKHKWTNINN